MAPDHLRAGLYYIQDPTSYKYLAVTRGQLEMSAETYIWEIRDTSDFTYQYIRVRDSEKYLRDNGSSYELVNTMDANSEWQGLSKSSGNIINRATQHHLKIPYNAIDTASDEKWQFEGPQDDKC